MTPPVHAFDRNDSLDSHAYHAPHTLQKFCTMCRCEVCVECGRPVIETDIYRSGEIAMVSPWSCGHGRPMRLVDDGQGVATIYRRPA